MSSSVKGSTIRVSPGAAPLHHRDGGAQRLQVLDGVLHLRVAEGQRQALELQLEFLPVDAGRTVERQHQFDGDGRLLRLAREPPAAPASSNRDAMARDRRPQARQNARKETPMRKTLLELSAAIALTLAAILASGNGGERQ